MILQIARVAKKRTSRAHANTLTHTHHIPQSRVKGEIFYPEPFQILSRRRVHIFLFSRACARALCAREHFSLAFSLILSLSPFYKAFLTISATSLISFALSFGNGLFSVIVHTVFSPTNTSNVPADASLVISNCPSNSSFNLLAMRTNACHIFETDALA